METHSNQPSQENPDHPQEQETLNDQGASSTQARSYECNFCKRGFSNAQALGGHMNIHRKHKATLKLHSSNDQSHQQEPLAYFSDMSTGGKSFMEWHDHAETNLVIAGNYAGEIQQLPLFDDKPPSVVDHQETSTSFEAHGSFEKGYSSHGMSSSETLDLELRLGPEPQDVSPPPLMGTKKFF